MALPLITDEQIWQAGAYGHRFNIGQFKHDPAGKRALEQRVKAGSVVKVTAMWPWLDWGTCCKTCYVNLEPIEQARSTQL